MRCCSSIAGRFVACSREARCSDSAILHFARSRNGVAAAQPRLAWLVDRWAAPRWVPWGNVFSVGDVLIAAGGLVFALAATGALRRRPRLATRATT